MFILFRKPPVPSVWWTSQQGDDVLHHDQEGQRRHLWRTDRRERANPVGPGPAQLLPSQQSYRLSVMSCPLICEHVSEEYEMNVLT